MFGFLTTPNSAALPSAVVPQSGPSGSTVVPAVEGVESGPKGLNFLSFLQSNVPKKTVASLDSEDVRAAILVDAELEAVAAVESAEDIEQTDSEGSDEGASMVDVDWVEDAMPVSEIAPEFAVKTKSDTSAQSQIGISSGPTDDTRVAARAGHEDMAPAAESEAEGVNALPMYPTLAGSTAFMVAKTLHETPVPPRLPSDAAPDRFGGRSVPPPDSSGPTARTMLPAPDGAPSDMLSATGAGGLDHQTIASSIVPATANIVAGNVQSAASLPSLTFGLLHLLPFTSVKAESGGQAGGMGAFGKGAIRSLKAQLDISRGLPSAMPQAQIATEGLIRSGAGMQAGKSSDDALRAEQSFPLSGVVVAPMQGAAEVELQQSKSGIGPPPVAAIEAVFRLNASAVPPGQSMQLPPQSEALTLEISDAEPHNLAAPGSVKSMKDVGPRFESPPMRVENIMSHQTVPLSAVSPINRTPVPVARPAALWGAMTHLSDLIATGQEGPGSPPDASRLSPLTADVRLAANLVHQGPATARNIAGQLSDTMSRSVERQIDVILNPVELGRVRITLVHSDVGMIVNVVAERAETLDLMRRHSDILGKEFSDLGYGQTDFTFGRDDKQDGGSRTHDRHGMSPDLALAPETGPEASITLQAASADRLDIRL